MKNIINEVYKNNIKRCLDAKTKWLGSKYEVVKYLSTTDKGNFGEDFTTELLNEIGYDAERVNGGIGDFDILIKKMNIKLEHKLATEDVHDSFQFNALDKDKKYDYVFCLGVSPNEILFNIYPKSDVKKLTTRMTKAEGGYKMTVRNFNMIPLTVENLKDKMKELIRNV